MKMKTVNIQLPAALKAKLDALRNQGYTASGFIQALLERELSQVQTGREIEIWRVKDGLTEGWFFVKTRKVETDGTSGSQIKAESAGLAVS